MQLNESEKRELIRLIEAGEPLPNGWRSKLFPNESAARVETGKEYRLVYDGKMRREEVLARTPAAPWQLEREFCADRPHGDGWRNLLVWGDNLLALRGLLADQQGPNKFGTRGKIKLIYIDPPFATRQDFMKDKEKAYRDKVLGAQFIEFLRRRLILLRELLADDGSIYVHLDWKKGHYLKAVLDEVFGEENFRNEIPWQRTYAHSDAGRFGIVHDTLYFYSKTDGYVFNRQSKAHSTSYIASHYGQTDEEGRRYRLITMTGAGQGPARSFGGRMIEPPAGRHWTYRQETIDRLLVEGKIVFVSTGQPNLKVYLDEMDGTVIQSMWQDIPPVNPVGKERTGYPTQKPEALLERIVLASSNPGDLVLDCFSGSGTTVAVSEKLGRRWIAMDSGKLAIYTSQKRLFSMVDTVGAERKDNRTIPDRVADFQEHLRGAPGMFLVTEKARRGECEVSLNLLQDLAALVKKHELVREDRPLSIACPESKLKIDKDHFVEPEEGPGQKQIVVDGVEFRVSIIEPKDKPEKSKLLAAKEFALFRAGVYDMEIIKDLPWKEYRPFVLKLFEVHEHPHARYGVSLDGYIGTDSALVWNYPDAKHLTLDYGYVDDLHKALRGRRGDRFYIIAPVIAMDFAEDEVTRGDTTYVFLKVPMSVLMRLIEAKEHGAVRQPMKEEDVNEVIDAVGFDFVSQPQVEWKATTGARKGELYEDYVLELSTFRAQTLTTDPEDFKNFETFSMAMFDLDYDGDVFRLSRVIWGDDAIKEAGGLDGAKAIQLRIPKEEFKGEKLMVILCDRYGNEKTLVLAKEAFGGGESKARKKSVTKQTRKKSTKRKTSTATAKKASAPPRKSGTRKKTAKRGRKT